MKKIYVFILLLSIVTGCKVSNPITGRKQMMLINPKSMFSQSALAYHQELEKNVPCTDARTVNTVKNVANKLINATQLYYQQIGQAEVLKDYKWEVNVIQKDVLNAFCMPGGKIMVLTGILKVTKNESGLAAVIGHEIAHALANHGAERTSQIILAQLGGIAVDVAAAKQDAQTREAINMLYGLGAQFGFILPFSRSHESEADVIGLDLMALAGYDPNEAAKVWERMTELSGQGTPAFLSTHPSHQQRIKTLRSKVPDAIAFADKYNPNRSSQVGYAIAPPIESRKVDKQSKPTTNTSQSVSVNSFAPKVYAKSSVVPTVSYTGTSRLTTEVYTFTTNAAHKTGTYYKIFLKATTLYDESDYAEVKKKNIGHIDAEFSASKGFYFVVLGDFTSLNEARRALQKVRSINAYKYSEMILYKDGDRIKYAQ